MIIDNKDKKLFQFFKENIGNGSFDVMTSYSSVFALAFMKNHLNQVEKLRIIFGNPPKEEKDVELSTIDDLIRQTINTVKYISFAQVAEQAIELIKQDKVDVRIIRTHGKSYIYHDKNPSKSFFAVGSSNLTEAGLGIKETDVVEANAVFMNDNPFSSEIYREYCEWFNKRWNEARDTVKLRDGRELTAKQYVIEYIQRMVKEKEFTPEILYNKILYEIFKNDFPNSTNDEEVKHTISSLEKTIIYKKLYPFQRRAVISLIKKLKEYNGAVLADAVGLGKTWTALAVMKHFQMQGYTVVLFCPKRLRNNWEQYKASGSVFQQDDLEYYVRNHTDLQNARLFKYYPDFPLDKLQRKQKLLIVIDESHNFRNDKSLRYEFLVNNILLPQKANRDVKVLLISATPINNSLLDLCNQFKLISRGLDNGFQNTKLKTNSIKKVFKSAQKVFEKWASHNSRKISDLVSNLPDKVKTLIDSLIIARTRKMIEEELNKMGMNLGFPEKEPPINEFVSTEIGKLKSIYDILDAIDINFTAYRPADYIIHTTSKNSIEAEIQTQRSLVKILYILLVKRCESSWFSFKITIESILKYCKEVLNKVEQFLEKGINNSLDEDINDFIENNLFEEDDDIMELKIGKKHPISISSVNIDLFKKHLQEDIETLSKLRDILLEYKNEFENNRAQDKKLNKLIEHIRVKQSQSTNNKVIIFTSYSDTAEFLYRELRKRGIERVALISGSENRVYDSTGNLKNFEHILERFAPFTKLYKEKDWTELYEKANLPNKYRDGDSWNVTYEVWLELIKKYDQETLYKLQNPVDVLIATDCLSEGQNLQDCDMVINYDIHWNPVRLIQRMGRIDRIGSPNKVIKGINFWPGSDYDEFLNLKAKVERKMALMTLANTEIDCKMTPELETMIKENNLTTKQEQEMLDQLQKDWIEVRTIEETLSLEEFSWEQFRQEFFEFLRQNIDTLKQIPIGAFTGFKLQSSKWNNIPNSIVMVLGFPQRPEEAKDHKYDEVYLLHLSIEDGEVGKPILTDKKEILKLIRDHKLEPRYVPTSIIKSEQSTIKKIVEAINSWIDNQVISETLNDIHNEFSGQVSAKEAREKQKASQLPKQTSINEKFKSERLDLIALFIISNE